MYDLTRDPEWDQKPRSLNYGSLLHIVFDLWRGEVWLIFETLGHDLYLAMHFEWLNWSAKVGVLGSNILGIRKGVRRGSLGHPPEKEFAGLWGYQNIMICRKVFTRQHYNSERRTWLSGNEIIGIHIWLTLSSIGKGRSRGGASTTWDWYQFSAQENLGHIHPFQDCFLCLEGILGKDLNHRQVGLKRHKVSQWICYVHRGRGIKGPCVVNMWVL